MVSGPARHMKRCTRRAAASTWDGVMSRVYGLGFTVKTLKFRLSELAPRASREFWGFHGFSGLWLPD